MKSRQRLPSTSRTSDGGPENSDVLLPQAQRLACATRNLQFDMVEPR